MNPQTNKNARRRLGPLLSSCAIAWMLLLLIAAPAQKKKPAQDEPVKLHSDLIVVNVTVTDSSGLYLHGLTAKDFGVMEDGARQQIDAFSAEEAPFAAAILIDMSGSMGYKFGLVRGAAASFLEQIRENDQVAVYGFNNQVRLFQEFSDSRLITDYIWDAKAEDKTRLYDCMDEAIVALSKREEKRRAILLISDGWDYSSHRASFDSVMKKALSAGVVVYSVDLIEDDNLMGSGSDAMFLRKGRGDMKQFAEQTGGKYVHSPHGDKMEESFASIIDELRNQYTLTYYSTSDKRDGRWRRLEVKVSRQGAVVRNRKGYFAPKG